MLKEGMTLTNTTALTAVLAEATVATFGATPFDVLK